MNKKLKIQTKLYGKLIYHNCLLSYGYPRIFLCVDKFNKCYILHEWEAEKDHAMWRICNLNKWNIPIEDFWLKDTKEDYAELPSEKMDLLDTLVYDYQVRLNFKDNSIVEEEISPRKWIDGKDIYL